MMRRLVEPMTVAQLKRHMDRRFDRLDRRKANKSDLRRLAMKNDMALIEARIDMRLGEVARQFDSVKEKIDSILTYVRGEIQQHTQVLDEHENRILDLQNETIG